MLLLPQKPQKVMIGLTFFTSREFEHSSSGARTAARATDAYEGPGENVRRF